MKFLILAAILGFAAASVLKDAAFVEGSTSPDVLREADGIDDRHFDQAADMITELGDKLREKLEKILNQIKERLERGNIFVSDLITQARNVVNSLFNMDEGLGPMVKKIFDDMENISGPFVKPIIEQIRKFLRIEKRSLPQENEDIESQMIMEKIRKMIDSNESMQKIREHIKSLSCKPYMVEVLKELIDELDDTDLREAIKDILETTPGQQKRDLKDTWEKIKDFLKQKHIDFKEKLGKFKDWLKDAWNKGLETLKDKHELIRGIAKEFIAHAKDLSAEVAREALEFFRPYKEDLGTLWKQIVDATKEVISKP